MKQTQGAAERSAGKIKKFVTLGLGKERYGIEVTKTREIIARYDIVPLPKTPEFIEGIISLRGDIIPIVDLRKRFELPARERDEDTRIIVIEMTDFTVGIQVDKVFEVLKLSSDAIEPPPPLVSGLRADYLQGVAEVNGKLTTILNLDEIFSTNERIILSGLEEGAGPENRQIRPAETTEMKEIPSAKKGMSSSTVSDDGMISYGGKSYYVGKKYKGGAVEISEADGRISAFADGVRVKEFEV